VIENTSWVIGDGKGINFWKDQWCGEPITQSFQLTTSQIQNYPQMLCDFVQNDQWAIPYDVLHVFPALRLLV
jgi:hypothetical protein